MINCDLSAINRRTLPNSKCCSRQPIKRRNKNDKKEETGAFVTFNAYKMVGVAGPYFSVFVCDSEDSV